MSPRHDPYTVDVVLLAPLNGELTVLLRRAPGPRARAPWTLPWGVPRGRERLATTALRVAREALGAPPAWIEQVGAFADDGRHPGDAPLSVAFVGVTTGRAAAAAGSAPGERGAAAMWARSRSLPPLLPRQRSMVEAAMDAVRTRADRAPIAFRFLPEAFTLSALQEMYELLLGRRLHKASFRRALHAARLVAPTDEWRSEGRGRPAQLFRFAPRKGRAGQRGVRFDLLREQRE
jgi:8-oxo-dGTP diphosphatase